MSRFRFGELVNILWIIWHGLSEWTCDELTKNFFLFFFFFLFIQTGRAKHRRLT
jgi:hypothetical protein